MIRFGNWNFMGLYYIDLSVLDISVVVEIKINLGGLGEWGEKIWFLYFLYFGLLFYKKEVCW